MKTVLKMLRELAAKTDKYNNNTLEALFNEFQFS